MNSDLCTDIDAKISKNIEESATDIQSEADE